MNKDIGILLGLHGKKSGPLEIAKIIEKGLSVSTIDKFKEVIDISDVQFSAILGVSTKTIGRFRKSRSSKLPVPVGDRLYRIANIYTKAKEVFENNDLAQEWLTTPQIGLNNQIPLDLLITEIGAREVEDLLSRIEYGILT